MANRKNFEAAIEIGGKLDRSLGDSINKASNGFGKLEKAGNKAATNIDRKFNYLNAHMKGKFVGSIGRATRAMGGLAAKSVAAIGAVSLAYAGIRSVGDFIHNSIEKYVESLDGLQQLETALGNNSRLAKQGATAILEQRDAVVRLARESQDLSGIKRSVFQAGFSVLATKGAGAGEIGRIQEGYRNYLAKYHSTRVTPDQARALSEQIVRAVADGRAGLLGRELSFTDDDLRKLKTANARFDFINKQMLKRYGGFAKSLAEDIPGKLALATYKFDKPIEEYGKKFIDLQDRWELLTLQTVAKLKPFLDPAIDWASGAVDSAVRFFEELGKPKHAAVLEELGRMFRKAWENIEAFGGAFVSAFGQDSKAFQGISSGIAELLQGKKFDLSNVRLPGKEPGWAKALMFDPSREMAQAQGIINAGLLSGVPQSSQDVFERELNLNVGQDIEEFLNRPITVFDNLRNAFQDFGNAIASLRPRFEEAGRGLGKFAAINFDTLVTSLEKIGSAAERLANTLGGAGNIMNVAGNVALGPAWSLLKSIGRHGIQSSPNAEVQPIPGRATGGIFRKAHLAMIGEAGPEAIIPLKRNKHSLGLLDAAAGAMGVGASSGSSTIHKTINIKPTINITGVDTGTAQQVADEIIAIVKGAMENEESASISAATA